MPHVTEIATSNGCQTFADFTKLHEPQLKNACIPEHLWSCLFHKLKNEVFDAGETFMIMKVEEDEEDEEEESDGFWWQVQVIQESGIKADDPQQVYLVDHAWTYRVEQARSQLQQVPGLLQRMADMMDISTEDKDTVTLVEEVFREMWRYNQTYSIGNASLGTEAATPVWYIMDEFGSKIQHSDDPSCRLVPFIYVPTQVAYSVLWPIEDIDKGGEVTRTYVEGEFTDILVRKARLLPWIPDDLTHLSYEQKEDDESFFEMAVAEETLPNLEKDFPSLPRDRNIRVYTTATQIREHLTDSRFEFVDTFDEADIIWIRDHFKDFRDLSENYSGKLVNQFPWESVLTVKDLLASVSRRAAKKPVNPDTMESYPTWLPTTYNLKTELPKFVSYFQHRSKKGLDNHWICKPWNLARGLDHHVTDNLNYILRLPDTGPKVACKYIEDPVLIERSDVGQVKFDLRYVVMLSSVNPLKAYVHQKFLVRFANKPFSLSNLEDYETHFTVMNYREGISMLEMPCEDFVELFESQHPAYPWKDTETSIVKVTEELLQAATSMPPPKGIAHSPQSRAMYGLDFMLKWTTNDQGEKIMQPMLIEVNYGPDFTRHCKYYQPFLDDVFSVMFFEDSENRPVVML